MRETMPAKVGVAADVPEIGPSVSRVIGIVHVSIHSVKKGVTLGSTQSNFPTCKVLYQDLKVCRDRRHIWHCTPRAVPPRCFRQPFRRQVRHDGSVLVLRTCKDTAKAAARRGPAYLHSDDVSTPHHSAYLYIFLGTGESAREKGTQTVKQCLLEAAPIAITIAR